MVARSLNPGHTLRLVQNGQPVDCPVRLHTAVRQVCPRSHTHSARKLDPAVRESGSLSLSGWNCSISSGWVAERGDVMH